MPRQKRRRPLVLSTTALIDVFSILVIFLLFQFSAEKTSALRYNLKLPRSTEGIQFSDRAAIYFDEAFNGKLIIEENETTFTAENFKKLSKAWIAQNREQIQTDGINLFADEKVKMGAIKIALQTLRESQIEDFYFSVRTN